MAQAGGPPSGGAADQVAQAWPLWDAPIGEGATAGRRQGEHRALARGHGASRFRRTGGLQHVGRQERRQTPPGGPFAAGGGRPGARDIGVTTWAPCTRPDRSIPSPGHIRRARKPPGRASGGGQVNAVAAAPRQHPLPWRNGPARSRSQPTTSNWRGLMMPTAATGLRLRSIGIKTGRRRSNGHRHKMPVHRPWRYISLA